MAQLPPEIVELGDNIRDLKEQLKAQGLSNKMIKDNEMYQELAQQLDTMKIEAGFDPKTNKPLQGDAPRRPGTPKKNQAASQRVVSELMAVSDLLEEAIQQVREGHERLQRERTEIREQKEEATRAIEEAEATRQVLLQKLGR
ncbi:unnamed protein product [Prorocentrum cordatum]|uniref:Uncharacterized protein n=1 Tax=Prorocentrum cordatum TaxID=2364126 RepID=A0ABN9XUB7_9DINO|nr:unnamed protein product [Polarella glacialis]